MTTTQSSNGKVAEDAKSGARSQKSGARGQESGPTPNIACATSFATSSDSHPSLGLFDLGDSISALLFAQFILSISWQVREIKNASSTPRTAPLSWRCDDPIDNIHALENKQWKHTNNIASWARDVADTSSDTHSPKSPTLSFRSIMSTSATRRASSRAPSSKAPSAKAPSAKIPSATRSRGDMPAAKKKIYLSNSVLAAQLDSGLGSPTPTFVSFEFERGVVPISSIQIPTDHPGFGHLHEFLAEYKDMLKYTLVEGWAAVDDLRVVNGLLHTRRDRLWEDHAANYNLEKTRLDALPDSKDPNHPKQTIPTCLDSSLAGILESRLELILAVTYGMSLQMYISGQRAVYESEWRYQWDTMQSKCYVTAKELISTQVLLERHVNLSRNRAVDFSPDTLNVWALDRYDYCILARALLGFNKALQKSNAIKQQYLEAVNEAAQIQHEVNNIVATKSNFPEFFKDRAAREPRRAVCDSFLFVPIAGALASSEPCSEYLKNFGLVEHTGEQEKLINFNARNVMLQQASATEKPIQLVAGPLPATRESTLPGQTNDVLDDESLHVPGEIPHQSRATRTTLANVITPSIGSLDAAPLNSGPGEFSNVPPADALLLPDLVSEYKKQTCSEMQAVNQTRSYLIASVTFLASIGIKDHRVFGLATDGPKGGILMAWWAAEDEKIYIIERDIHTFDISTPTGAVQFAIFLIRLRAANDKIKKRFADHEERAKTMAKSGHGFERWTKAAQVMDLNNGAAAYIDAGDS
ncbi:hypothetical protein FIBSPDRAFT_1055030 [Athelia psychrophila]|uniref:Uncharacterized protein n=1 Tax=Athelia psychrophila TaxID=1759441 RepID=A0A167UES8_9AGAM|nr:hypothetical protein FIBSPDRAFT_1055030 [Fibularhizoctonia sp. CBS 109695]